jgi:hypothetical protein
MQEESKAIGGVMMRLSEDGQALVVECGHCPKPIHFDEPEDLFALLPGEEDLATGAQWDGDTAGQSLICEECAARVAERSEVRT